ncbi:hypothetical protein EI94DRAFT_1773748 [Lactarius quietus]|nr:hypothetical protein EI94DRAFT_1773748 [Lactarius quietus]
MMVAISSLLLLIPAMFAAQACASILHHAPQFTPAAKSPLDQSTNYVGANNGSLRKTTVAPGSPFDRFTSATFANLSSQGILLDQYYAVTHPSELNYVASVGGDFFGPGDDTYTTSHGTSYQEDMPADGYEGFKGHDGLMIYDSIAAIDSRWASIRNFNDIAVDRNASAIPQWFDNRTLILLTFGETEMYTINYQIYAVLLGGTTPIAPAARTLSKVFSFVANATNYTNLDISGGDIPLTNLTGKIPGPLNAKYYLPFTAPNTSTVSAGGGPVVDCNLTAVSAPAPVNLTAKNETVPWSGPRVAANISNSTTTGKKGGAAGTRELRTFSKIPMALSTQNMPKFETPHFSNTFSAYTFVKLGN